MKITSAKELIAYQKAYELAMHVFVTNKAFPKEERYSLTDQIRRSSRSTCANIREAWSKRRYEAHFLSKLTDADGENAETSTWLDFARSCAYLTDDSHSELSNLSSEVGAMLGSIIKNPTPFLLRVRDQPNP